MRVLLTGANGFVGSHILDCLVQAGHEVAVMLRPTSDTRFIRAHLASVDVRYGSLDSPESLREAFAGAQVVVHCAAKTKALRRAEYYAANAQGALHVAEACNACSDTLRQLVLISSLAATGPGTPQSPAREDEALRPVSAYGKSKLLGEQHVRERCQVPYTILRPAAVYGPRDGDFLLVFKAVRGGLAPLVAASQALSLIYAQDVAQAVLRSIDCAAAFGKAYHLAHPTPCTQDELVQAVAEALGANPWRLRLPWPVLYPVCFVRGLWARLRRRPSILNMDKIAEYRAPGWVCDTSRARQDLGFTAATPLDEGLRRTAQWYADAGWL